MELLTVATCVFLTLIHAFGIFLSLGFLVWPHCEGFLPCLVFCLVVSAFCLLDACSFLKGERGGVDEWEGRLVGGWEEGRRENCGRNVLYERRIFL